MQIIVKIYGILLSNKIALPKYIGVAFLIDILPAIFLSSLVSVLINIFDSKHSPLQAHDLSWITFWLGVIFTPVVETFLLIFTLYILRGFNIQGFKLAIIAAIFWGTLHATESWSRFFAPAWIFFIYATAYETWRLTSFRKAYFAAAIPHILNNLVAFFANGLGI